MNHIDFLLDMLVGQDDSSEIRRRREETKDNSEFFGKKLDFGEICRLHRHHLHSLRSSFNKSFVKRMFRGRLFTLNRRKNNVKSDDLENAEEINHVVETHKIQNIYFNKDQPNFFEIAFREMFGFDVKEGDLDSGRSSNDKCNNAIATSETKRNNSLELFFQSLLKSTSEFSEEEILMLQIQILKIVKNMKSKRELRQNFRKYCLASMHFKDSIINLGGNVNTIN